MPDVTVTLPGLLARFTDGRRTVSLEAATLGGSLDRLIDSYPDLEPHLFDERGRLRPHVELYHDGSGATWPEDRTVELADGDEIVVLQAVSGG